VEFQVEATYLAPISIGVYEWVTVRLPDGRYIKIYADKICVATEREDANRKDGTVIWDAMSPSRFPYGRTRVVGGKAAGE